MLFKITNRYRKKSFEKNAEKYFLYVKWGSKGVHSLFSKHDTKEEAIEQFQKLKQSKSSLWGKVLSNDFRVKRCFQQYVEESISVPTFKEIENKLPELKGIFLD
jgi:hypothetical protein